jgi:SAM-dependent methyltransferase
MILCPLCLNKESFEIVKGPDSRAYRGCNKCKLIFTETRFQPAKKNEKKRYLTHNKGIQYKGYGNFLNQAIEPALPLLTNDMQGLDFGCGPEPTLSAMLREKGISCDDYDPIFFPEMPEKTYDFIFATESFEHFFFPAKEIQCIKNLIKPNGYLIVMTEKWKSIEAFKTWSYAKDATRVSFYHLHTFRFIATKFGFGTIESNNDHVVILQKLQAGS